MKNFKRLVALGLVGTMVMGGTITAFAADGDNKAEVTGTGTAGDLVVDNVIYSLTIPTAASVTQTLSYKVDPQGLAAKKGDVAAGSTVLFKNGTGAEAKYSSKSDSFKFVSKSSVPIELTIKPVLKPATAASGEHVYAGGYSTTSDFSGDGDDAKGLYLGIHSTNEVEKALSETALDYKNLIYSARDLFAVDGSYDAGYTFALPASVEESKLPTYEFYVTGALNPDMPTATWIKYAADEVTVESKAAMPTIELKYTPTALTAATKTAVAKWDKNYNITIKKETATETDGGFPETGATVTVNGKAVTSTVSKGVITLKWEDIAKAYDSSYTASKYGTELNTADQAVVVTVPNDGTYYGVAK